MKEKVLYFYAVAALLLPNVGLCFTEGMDLWACVANLVFPSGLVVLLLAAFRNPGKSVWTGFPLIFLAAFQLVLLYLFGQGIISVDMFLNVATSNSDEIRELLDNLVPAVGGVFVIYLPLLAAAVWAWHGRHTLTAPFLRGVRRVGCVLVVVGTLCVEVAVQQTNYQVDEQLYPVNVCYNLGLALQRAYQQQHYVEATADYRFEARSEHPADSTEVYVLVVGETARAHNFALYGYGRDTNPLLSQQESLVAFSRVTTQSNTTHRSVPMLLTAATAADYNRLYHEKGILAAFREAGFHTVFLSNQRRNHSFIDFLGMQADECLFLREQAADGDAEDMSDERLVDGLAKVLAQGRKKELVVLHTYGSHFNYRERYGREWAFFTPDDRAEAVAENRRDLLNAYDNTLRFTDHLLHRIIGLLQARGGLSAMLYTSDHGENIFDDGGNHFLHAGQKASLYELHVPFLVWTSDSYGVLFPAEVQALQANRNRQVESSVSTFHTLLQLGGVQTPVRADSLSLASGTFVERPRRYVNDRNEALPLDVQL
ncbi:MAG: sulfatase-like hydrolase/transferase [Alloprevotella sp.]